MRILPKYGNWGGPGYSAGVYNDDPTKTDWTLEPLDDMDVMFQHHDYAYQHNNFPWTIYQADKDLVEDLIDIGNPWTWKKKKGCTSKLIWVIHITYAMFYRKAATKLFYFKMLADHLILWIKGITHVK